MTQTITPSAPPPAIYQGQFGEFTITKGDRQGVVAYRAALGIAALCFGVGALLALYGTTQGGTLPPAMLMALTYLYWGFTAALGVSLVLIHIYMAPLHRALQISWLIGTVASLYVSVSSPEPLLLTIYQHPITLLGIGFTFVALTGIAFKEAFCFNRLETKGLTFIVPILLLGHLMGFLPLQAERLLLLGWAALMLVFALRKAFQAIPDDIGDKSVFEYLKAQQQEKTAGRS